jgi:peptide-methionine (R)-S-oxide reductase
MKSDEELQKERPDLYKVAREGGTEAPFTGKYVNEKHDGMYHCAVCGAPLFSSASKFDSNTGWPSFTDPAVAEAVTLHEDTKYGMNRTEVRCKACGAHLGHVFADGPKKADGNVCDRYCINSVSLELRPNNETHE